MSPSKLTLTILVLLLYFNVTGQKRIIKFQNISYENGISNNRVNNIIQDRDGFLWFSTRIGIDKYNGLTARTYLLPSERVEVNTLLQDKSDRIWAATTRGLFYYDPEKDNFERWSSSDTSIDHYLESGIPDLLEMGDGNLWCTTTNGAIISLSPDHQKGTLVHQIPKDGANRDTDYATDLLLDENGNIWIATGKGKLWVYTDTEFNATGFTGNTAHINTLGMDREGYLWIGTNGNGLFKYDTAKKTTVHYLESNRANSKGISNNIVLDILVDGNNRVWIGTDGGGLNLYLREENAFYVFMQNTYYDYPIADNSILDIYEGADKVIWLGTVHGGVSYFKDHILIHHVPPPDIAFNQMDEQGSQILEASNGDIWITAGRNGLRRYDIRTGKVSVFIDDPQNDADLSGNNILSLHEDDLNRIWIGTLRGGLNIYDTKNNTFLSAEDKFNCTSIFAMEKDRDGNIWVGTDTGIKIYSPELKIVKTYHTDTERNLNSNHISSLYKDIKGDMWVGTTLGLSVFKKDTVLSYRSDKTDPHTLSGDRVISIAEDDDLSILIGTYGYGLNRYHRGSDRFTRIGKAEGLEANVIGGIFLDRDRNIWCSTNLGLSKILSDGTIENYNAQHGVQSFSGGSAIISKDNFIFMGGHIGLTYFKASELKPNNTAPPKVFFTSGRVLGEQGSREIRLENKANDHITLKPGDELLSVHFSSSDYWTPKDNDYAYLLEGLHKEWQIIGNIQLLTFSNLNPGEYLLKINSVQNIGQDDTSMARIGITVLPSLWQRTWVRLLIVLFGAFSVVLFINWRLSQANRQKKRLRLLVESKTEEIKAQQIKVHQGEIALLKIEKENQELNQKKLKEDLNFKTEELTNYTLRTVHKNNLLNEIKNSLLVEIKEGTPRKASLDKIVSLIDDSLILDGDWENFYNLFNQINTNFIPNLRNYCPQLSDREIRLCALIKLNFNSQHIATLFGISLSSVKVARHRLRKKLNIAENISFEEFFETLDPS